MSKSSNHSPPLFILVDGHSLAFRSYYAHTKGQDGGLRTSTGIPTSVSYGFLKSLLDMMESEQPDYAAVAFDLDVPTFRHDADTSYKDGRIETPEDFLPDLQNLQAILTAFKLPVITAAGYEADDVLGTLARRASTAGFQVKILSGDRDLFQLVDADKRVSVLYLSSAFGPRGNSGAMEIGVAQVQEKMGVLPTQVVDYKALCGDASDNIPGVKGIGAKTAVKLLTDYGSLVGIYESIDQIKGAVHKKLETGKESAKHSQFMAQIHLDVALDVSLEQCKLEGFDPDAVTPWLQKLELRQLINRIPKLQYVLGGEVSADQLATLTRQSSKRAAESAHNRWAQDGSAHDGLDSSSRNDEDLWFFSADETESSQRVVTAQISPHIIDTDEKLAWLVEILHQHCDPAAPVAWDTETTALEPRDANLVGIGCCWGSKPDEVAYVPLGHQQGRNLGLAIALNALRPILESSAYPKAFQNSKFDRLILRSQGIEMQGVVFDPMLASYVLNPEASHNLGDLSLRYLNLATQSYGDLVPKGKTIGDIEIAQVADYCGTDAYTTFQLVPKLQAQLDAIPELKALFHNVEIPLEPVLADMEYDGIRIDIDYLQQFSRRLTQDLAVLETQAHEAAGQDFNLGSPKQLSELLFDILKLDRRKSRKTKTGYSTDAATLEKLQGDHPVIDAITEHRTLSKLKSTYVEALPLLVHSQTQRIHTDFNQAVTATGRLSSSNPNLQNIPIRTAFSRQIRAAFIPQSDWLLVSADYSQIELRILAHLSQEPVLIETYRTNQDVHTLTARLLLEKDEITSDERRLGKVINFGVIYGMGASRFAREAGVSRVEAQRFIDRFYERYSHVFEFLQRMEREAIAHGYVSTIRGRRRYFNFTSDRLKRLKGSNPDDLHLDQLRSLGQYDAGLLRAAANAPIQGSSADIIKIAMINLHTILKDFQARLLLQVHDELVFEVPPDEWDDLKAKIKTTMESAVTLDVPLVVEISAGQNWMEAK